MDLKDQLVKAGLVSAKQARQTAHRERVERKQDAGADAQREVQARAEEAQRQKEAQRLRDQSLNRERLAQQAEHERHAQAEQHRHAQIEGALREGRVDSWSGARNYFFQVGPRLEVLQVSDEVARLLQDGKLAIIRTLDPRAPYTVLRAGPAQRLRDAAPGRIVTLHAAGTDKV
jgi:uncharacterized protein YaiL (DUF2058 family)